MTHKSKSEKDVSTPIEALTNLVRDVDELVRNSAGVKEMFGNVDEPWSELLNGRLDAWLGTGVEAAKKVLREHERMKAETDALGAFVDPKYQPLADVLRMALDQAQNGKGRDRHADDRPFLEQPILNIARMLDGVGGHAYQIAKKAQEATRMARRDQDGAAINEFLGVIVYASAAVILIREKMHRHAADAFELSRE